MTEKSQYNINLTDTSFNSLVKRIIITLVRVKGNHKINLTVEDIEEIKSLSEISISNSVCDEIQENLEIELMFIERVYITQYLASSQLIIKNTQDNLHLKILQKLVVTLMDDDFRSDVIKVATKEEVLSLLNGII